MKTIRNAMLCSGVIAMTVATGIDIQAAGNSVYAYPNANQSQPQQSQDRYECNQWAVNESGFDPTRAEPVAQSVYSTQQRAQASRTGKDRDTSILGIGDGGVFKGSGALGDAATGAAIGAAGGAIAGNTGKGAAWGAVGGTILGALTRAGSDSDRSSRRTSSRDYRREAERAEYERQVAEREAQMDDYRRAFSACMTARNYTVQ
ncbi:MAG: hypothetical protein H6978_15990 [Gammaproteobacteria bacterium]|nr:hypothetical protein [Gammaproteobacteria bacterium]